MWRKKDADWKPLRVYTDENVRCGMSGQQIRAIGERDLLTYQCLNRWDEDPFDTQFKNKSKAGDWIDAVNTTCSGNDQPVHCMGQNAGQCIAISCKFLILIPFSSQFVCCTRHLDMVLI